MSQVQVVIYKHMEFNSPKIPEIPANKQVYTYRYVIIIHTVSWNSVVMTRKIGLMDRSKTLYPPQLIVWGIVHMVHVHVENNLLGK